MSISCATTLYGDSTPVIIYIYEDTLIIVTATLSVPHQAITISFWYRHVVEQRNEQHFTNDWITAIIGDILGWITDQM